MLISPLDGQMIGGKHFHIAEWTQEPCPPEGPMWVAPLHRHHECDEAWYVLEGRLSFLVDGEEITANPGDLVWVAKGLSHTYWNPDATPARYLLLMTDKTKTLIDAIHQASDRSLDGIKQLFASHDAEFIGWSL